MVPTIAADNPGTLSTPMAVPATANVVITVVLETLLAISVNSFGFLRK